MGNLTDVESVMFHIRIKFSNGNYVTLGRMQVFNNDKANLLKLTSYFIAILALKANEYFTHSTDSLICSYFIKHSNKQGKTINKITQVAKATNNKIKQSFHVFSGLNLPNTMDYGSWGYNLEGETNGGLLHGILFKSKLRFSVRKVNEFTNVISIFLGMETIIRFKDIKNPNDPANSFTRVLSNGQTYHFIEGELALKKEVKKTSFLKSIFTSRTINKKIITLDIETRTVNNVMTPYAISFYDGKKSFSYYLTDFNSIDDMLSSCVHDLLRAKYDGYKIYIHNLSNFDSTFLLRVLAQFKHCKFTTIMNKGQIIDIKVKFNDKYNIHFRDSLLLLPTSLRKLSKSFGVINKGIFPYKFSNVCDLNYVGPFPDFKYFEGITQDEYNILVLTQSTANASVSGASH